MGAKKRTPYGERLVRALAHAKLDQTQAAEKLTKVWGKKTKPQTVQYLCVKGKASIHTAELASMCGVRYPWLAHDNGPMVGTSTAKEIDSAWLLDCVAAVLAAFDEMQLEPPPERIAELSVGYYTAFVDSAVRPTRAQIVQLVRMAA